MPQPFHRTYATDGILSNNFPTPHITGSGIAITEGVGQVSLSSPLNGVDLRPALSESNLNRGQTALGPLHQRDPIDLQQLDNSGNQHASANDDAPVMLPTSVAGSSRAETRNVESEIHPDQESFLRGHELDARYDDPQGTSGGPPQGDTGPYFYNRSSNTVLMQEVNDIISPVTCPDQNTNTERSRDDSSIYSAPGTYNRVKETIRKAPSYYLSFRHQMSFFELPPRSLADHLLDSYFNRVHLLYPFLHRPTFEAAYEQLWAPADQRSGNGRSGDSVRFADAGLGSPVISGQQTRIFYAGVNAIFALSCQFSDLPILEAREAAKAYLERAMALLLDTEQLDYPTLSLLQLLLLLCLHLQGTPLRNRLWNVMGMASRIAQGLGLQFEDSEDGKTKSILEIEIRRRTWYSCVMMDLWVAHFFQRGEYLDFKRRRMSSN